jgi:glyoxylase-like metal-dependent hydrolase (beta-lactamase superfamily II)
MKILATATAVSLLLAGHAGATNITQKNGEKTRAIIEQVIEAYGGADKLDSLKTLIVEADTTGYAVNQSRKPEPPWDANHGKLLNAIDLENSIFVSRNSGSGAGFEFNVGQIINADDSYQLNYRARTAAPVLEPDYDTTSGPFIRVTSVLLVKQLQARGNTSHWLGEADVDGRPHDVITLVMQVGPALSLYFDQETHLLTRSERLLPPFGLVEYSFEDYYEVDGIPLNRRFQLLVNGDSNLDWKYSSIRINESIEDLTRVPASLAHIDAVAPDELSLNEISEGVYLVGGTGTYAMFVEMDDHIIAVGGTAGIPDRIAELRKVVGDKPIRYAVISHHHNDHVLGMPAYTEEGAIVLTVEEHETVLRNAAGEDAKPNFEFVRGSKILSDGSRTVEIHDIGPTPHSEHLLVAYLPNEGIMFEADHIAVPRTGPLPPAISNTRALDTAMAKRDFKVTTIVGAHSPRVITIDDMKAALEHEAETRVARK